MIADKHTVLVVDDDDVFRDRLVRALEDRGFEARSAEGGADAVALAREDSPELAIVDLRMPAQSGLDVLRELLQIDPTTRVVVLTGFGSIATALEAVRLGAVHYLTKPAEVDEIIAAFDPRPEGEPQSPDVAEHVPSLARVEWEHIQRVMLHCGDNVSQAARLLGIHRRSLQRKLSKRPLSR